MFTGIVEELGEVVGRETSADGVVLTVKGPEVVSDARHGDSISVNGVCLTVRDKDATGGVFATDVMPETLARTTIGALRVGDPVNLERAATLGTRLGGHLVQGHVDAVGTVVERVTGECQELKVSVPSRLARYLVTKGSVTVDGVSLTVTAVGENAGQGWFSVSLIPTTLRVTTLGSRGVGDHVNLEV
ncbi:MAG TPA: riboflavin synthase, partial [Micromonosporaceae bacterium]